MMEQHLPKDWDNAPEITVQVYKFKLFDKDFYTVLRSDVYEPFKKFIEDLNNFSDFKISKFQLFSELSKSLSVPFNGGENSIISYLGPNFCGVLEKIENEYRINSREHKIDQVTRD